MRARQLEVFRMVMRCGTITAAASALNVSQPALSQILLHTEDELGFKLFQRTKGRLVPTPEAEELFPEADRLFGELDGLLRRASELRQGKRGIVRLAASAPPSLSLVPSALKEFRAKHPDVRILSYVVPSASIITMIESGQAGIGVALNDQPFPLIQTEVIGHTDLVCVMPVDHPLAAREAVSVADLRGESVISYRHDSLPGQLLAAALTRIGETLTTDIEIDVSVIAVAFVQQRLGIAIVDGLLPWETFPGIVARPFIPNTVLPLCLLWSATRALSRNHQLLRDEIRRACRERGLAAPRSPTS